MVLIGIWASCEIKERGNLHDVSYDLLNCTRCLSRIILVTAALGFLWSASKPRTQDVI